jgi:hypothetical protein
VHVTRNVYVPKLFFVSKLINNCGISNVNVQRTLFFANTFPHLLCRLEIRTVIESLIQEGNSTNRTHFVCQAIVTAMEATYQMTRQEAESQYLSEFTEPSSVPASKPIDPIINEPVSIPASTPSGQLITEPIAVPASKPNGPNITKPMSVPVSTPNDSLIDVTDTQCENIDNVTFESIPIWHEIETIRLNVSDRELITNSNGMLNDKIIQAASSLLKLQFPEFKGLQDPILCFAGHITVDSCIDVRFVQIFNDPTKCHWVTVSNINCLVGQVDVYCSLLSCPSLQCLQAISTFVRVPVPELEIRVVNVARQRDYKSCGLYAIANAHALLMGKDPRNFVYSHKAMREHLAQCFENKFMEPVPIECFRTVRKSFVKIQNFPVFCICRKVCGNLKEDMVQCSFCSEWYHTVCIGMGDNSFDLHRKERTLDYTCQACNV